MIKKYLLHLCFAFLVLSILASCQKEEAEFIDEENEETITPSSTLANLLLRTSQNNGANDDLIDGNSCSSLVYPVTVTANGQVVILENEADIALVQQIFDQFPNDSDTLEISYPISVQLEDFTIVDIASQQELENLIEACNGGTAIACLDLVYPITFFVYNSNQQQTDMRTVTSDIDLFVFLNSLGEDDFIGIDFPIAVQLQDGSTISVSSNSELQALIENCDDNTTVDPLETIAQALTSGSWYVSYFFDDFDATDDFAGYAFTFAGDNSAQAVGNNTTTNGTWSLSAGTPIELDLFFGTVAPLDELDEDWDLIEATEEIVRLKNTGSDGSIDYLTFGRTPNTGGGTNTNLNQFIENLTTNSWFITVLDDSGEDKTCEFASYQFEYAVNGSVTATGTAGVVSGFWAVEEVGDGLELILNFDTSGGNGFSELNDDWAVTGYDATFIGLEDTSGGDTDRLRFERQPFEDCGSSGPDPQPLRDILQDGTWFVSQFLEKGDDETQVFSGFDFTFNPNQTVLATNGSVTVNGSWIVSVVGQRLNFEFDMDSPLNDADDNDYEVLDASDTLVTFVTRDGDGAIEDTLQFRKN
jgi:hypothetical protein